MTLLDRYLAGAYNTFKVLLSLVLLVIVIDLWRHGRQTLLSIKYQCRL